MFRPQNAGVGQRVGAGLEQRIAGVGVGDKRGLDQFQRWQAD
jgi:hypothetical protein